MIRHLKALLAMSLTFGSMALFAFLWTWDPPHWVETLGIIACWIISGLLVYFVFYMWVNYGLWPEEKKYEHGD